MTTNIIGLQHRLSQEFKVLFQSHFDILFTDLTVPREASMRGALKTRICSGLDSWIVPMWSLKNKMVFRIGLMDRPHVKP